MIKALYFGIHLAVPLACLVLALWRRPHSLLGLWSVTALILAVYAFLFLWGQWPLVGSYYLRLLPLVAGVIVLLSALRATAAGLPARDPRWFVNLGSVVALLLAGFVGWGVAAAIAGRHYAEPGVALEWPLRNGRYYIASGGARRVINNHQRPYPNSQEFALDINKLGPVGAASRNVLSADNRLHYIYGEPVYAPCAGVVVEAVGDVADHLGASMNVRPEDGMGNYVILDCADARVWLVHLQQGSVTVAPGTAVELGQRLGAVGNSGFSQEPHLHFQAATRRADGNWHGVPMRFDGRAYLRNDVVNRR